MKKLCLLILFLSVVLRVIYLVQLQQDTIVSQNTVVDETSYDRWAQEIAGEKFWGDRVFYQSPFYPYFLGIIYKTFGRHFLLVRIFQMIVGLLTLFLVYRLAATLINERAGLVSLALGGFYALFPYYESLLLKDIFGPFFIILCTWALFRWIKDERRVYLLLSGASLGLLALVRENLILLVIPITIYLLVRYRRNAATALFVAGFALIILPVGLRNCFVGNEFVVTSSQFGANFYIGNSPHSSGIYAQVPFVRANPSYEEADFKQEAQRRANRGLSPHEVSAFWFRESLRYIRNNPSKWLKLLGKKILYFTSPYEIADNRSVYFFKDRFPALKVFWVHFSMIFSLGLLGTVASVREHRKFILLYLVMFVVFLGTILFFVVGRYRFPLMPFLLIFAAYYVDLLYKMRKDRRKLFLHAAGLGACLVIFNLNLTDYDTKGDFVQGYHNLGYSYFAKNDYDNALIHFKKALELDPNSMEGRGIVGEIYKKQGRLSEAIRELEMAKRSSHVHIRTVALLNLGEIYINKHEFAKAKDYLNEVLQLRPQDYYPNLYMGNVFYEEDKYSECLEHWEKALKANPGDKKLERNIRKLRESDDSSSE